jgi:proline iminopeptidase
VQQQTFFVEGTPGLAGWRQGAGAPVLLLHGGPGLSFGYLQSLADELGHGFDLAAYQQRGLAPSGESGPFTVTDNVADLVRVLDHLGWDRTYLVGHSWGGHLALHALESIPDRLLGALVVDPLGAVGDGGEQEFNDEMYARTPEHVRARAMALDEQMTRGEGGPEAALEGLRLVWPAYFPVWEEAPPMPPMSVSPECFARTNESANELLPALEASLGEIRLPVGFVHGERSPMPRRASTEAAERIAGAWVEIVPGAGHFPWIDVPGSVRAALERLVG